MSAAANDFRRKTPQLRQSMGEIRPESMQKPASQKGHAASMGVPASDFIAYLQQVA
jgi:hypothetical protein